MVSWFSGKGKAKGAVLFLKKKNQKNFFPFGFGLGGGLPI
jgi:hypothetical protein